MKITFNRSAMLDAFGAVSGTVPARSPLPILQSVLLEAGEGGVKLTATDLEIGVRRDVGGVKVEAPGAVVLNAARFGQFLRASSGEDGSLELKGEAVEIRCGRARVELPTQDPALFPVFPEFDAESYYEVAPDDLKCAIRRTTPAAEDFESLKWALKSVAFQRSGESSVVAVSLDGVMLASFPLPCVSHGLPWDENTAGKAQPSVVPLKAAKAIERSLDESGANVMLAFGERSVHVRSDSVTVWARLAEGRFPNWRMGVPASPEFRVPLNAKEFAAAVRGARVTTSEEKQGVNVDIRSGVMALSATAPDVGRAEAEMSVDYEGPEIKLRFDGSRLTDFLKAAPDTVLTAEITDSVKPVIFRSECGWLGCITPQHRMD